MARQGTLQEIKNTCTPLALCFADARTDANDRWMEVTDEFETREKATKPHACETEELFLSDSTVQGKIAQDANEEVEDIPLLTQVKEMRQQIATHDRAILIKIFQTCNGRSWIESENWGSDEPISTWHHVWVRLVYRRGYVYRRFDHFN